MVCTAVALLLLLVAQTGSADEPASAPPHVSPAHRDDTTAASTVTIDREPTKATAAVSSVPNAGTRTRRRELRPRWCVLPVGDSLTQGVGKYGSYREPLLRTLRSQARGVVRVGTAGTQSFPCTPKRPGEAYQAAAPAKHEGHCNWDSGALARHVAATFASAGSSPQDAPADKDDGATAECGAREFHTILLMVGHNDVFRAAKACRVREGCEATWAPRGHDVPEASPELIETLPTHLRCAMATLRRGFMNNTVDIALRLLRRVAGPPPARVARFQSSSTVPSLVVGVNPPTGFPCLDVMLHAAVRDAVSAIRARLSSAELGFEPVVALARFDGFARGTHTFDSTHPNREGAELLARGWNDAIVNADPGDR